MKRLPAGELRELLSNKLSQIVEKPDVVNAVCDGLIWASLRGVDSHGIRLAPHYFDAAKLGRVDVTASPSFDVGGQSFTLGDACLLYTSPSPRDRSLSRMPSSA